MPALEDVAPQIEAQLLAQSEQQAVAVVIDALRSEAEIEVKF